MALLVIVLYMYLFKLKRFFYHEILKLFIFSCTQILIRKIFFKFVILIYIFIPVTIMFLFITIFIYGKSLCINCN